VILRDAKPAACSSCGRKSFVGQLWQYDNKFYCAFCMVKEGKVMWVGDKWIWQTDAGSLKDVDL
jgi:hypothetical protein